MKHFILGPVFFPGGETEALKRLEISMKNKTWVCKFEKPNTEPNSLKPSTTVLSPYLKFGCLSSRRFYYELKDIYSKCGSYSKPPVSLEGQLLWREFFYANAATIENYSQMKGNRICKQINWSKNEEYLRAWSEGRTGYPFIGLKFTFFKLFFKIYYNLCRCYHETTEIRRVNKKVFFFFSSFNFEFSGGSII